MSAPAMNHREQAWSEHALRYPNNKLNWEQADVARGHWLAGYDVALSLAEQLAAALEWTLEYTEGVKSGFHELPHDLMNPLIAEFRSALAVYREAVES